MSRRSFRGGGEAIEGAVGRVVERVLLFFSILLGPSALVEVTWQ